MAVYPAFGNTVRKYYTFIGDKRDEVLPSGCGPNTRTASNLAATGVIWLDNCSSQSVARISNLERLVVLGTIAGFFLWLPLAGTANTDEAADSSVKTTEYTISVDVGLVILPVVVTDRHGEAVSGLHAKDFRLYDDGHPRQITIFEHDDVPATIGLVVDNSGSMLAKRAEVIAAGLEFARTSNPLDQMFVVNFNQTASLGLGQGVPFTSNMQELNAALSRNAAAGNTALYDGIALALQHIKAGTRQRKALIVISDGGDNSSELSLSSLIRRVEQSNVVIDTIGLVNRDNTYENPAVLKTLAKISGGNAYFPKTVSEVTAICREIAQDIRYEYTLGYAPAPSVDKYHTIRVTAQASGKKGLRVRTRAGYFMTTPSEAPQALVGKLW